MFCPITAQEIGCTDMLIQNEINDISYLPLSTEYDDYTLSYSNEENDLPFEFGMITQKESIHYSKHRVESYCEISNTALSENELTDSSASTHNYLLYESYMPIIDLDTLKYDFSVSLKKHSDENVIDCFNLTIWNDVDIIFNGLLSESPSFLPININSKYNFALFVNGSIFCVGESSFFMELNNKIIGCCDYMIIDDSCKYDPSKNEDEASFSGYYTTVIIPKDFSIDSKGALPTYNKKYLTKGENTLPESFADNSVIYRSANSSPVWYSQMNANATGGSWVATNLSSLFYTTSTSLTNSSISTDKPFYSTNSYNFMRSGCALTCLAMLYRNRGDSVSRSYDYRGVSLTNTITDPFTLTLVNTSKTTATGTSFLAGKNYYIVTDSPVYVNWSTCANYYGYTSKSYTFPSSYSTNQKAAVIASKIDNYDGGVVVCFQSGTSTHYLLFTSYTMTNGVYTFTVCDPGRSTSYNQAVTTLENTYKTYCQTLDNAISIRYVD